MAEEFDAGAESLRLSALVKATGDGLRSSVPPPEARPLFFTQPDGSVTDRAGKVLRGPLAPPKSKG